jgi:hypothetical protein
VLGVGPLADTCGEQGSCSRLGGPRCPAGPLTRWWARPGGDVSSETRGIGGVFPGGITCADWTLGVTVAVVRLKERLIRVIALATARAAAISTEGRAVVLAVVTVCSAWTGSAISVAGCTAGRWMGARRAFRQLGAAEAGRAVRGACGAGAGRSARLWPYTRR